MSFSIINSLDIYPKFFWVFLEALAILSSSDLTFFCNFWISSSGGRFSGLIPLLARSLRTSALFLICSLVIGNYPSRFSFLTLKLVISVAKFLAVIVMVGKKSASGLFCGIFSLFFISKVVSPPNKASSPLLLIRAKPASSTPRS